MRDKRTTLVTEWADAPWLPPHGRAQAISGGQPPAPMCLVRLLLKRDGEVFCVPRDGGGKLDLPTRMTPPEDADGAETIARLVIDVTGAAHTPHYLGAVRNIVHFAGDEYPWPSPLAHFGVWTTDAQPAITGVWLNLESPQSPLRDRHWHSLAHP